MNQNTCFVFSKVFFSKIMAFMKQYGELWQIWTGHRWQYNKRVHCTCWI